MVGMFRNILMNLLSMVVGWNPSQPSLTCDVADTW